MNQPPASEKCAVFRGALDRDTPEHQFFRPSLDTFDMFSPEYDSSQRIEDIAAMFHRHSADVTFSGFEYFDGFSAAVLRGTKRA